ncbi:pirin family protein [Noviherbaspirillum sp. CPCC 100848]|uniref:Pirin family protein n=1 Tax=Noviherbaspirillum album TaxID=3080276 RepID=A0ABU6J7Y6_9BURK|nr:pirin family protein [Noviherbaspirillum sp. CPCC 100848]MEC4719309.1 pirin family protein [Noviherbaspirillum sp. CPCC 100848]
MAANPLALVKPHVKNLGDGFTVRRLLPSHPHKMVGPFIFFDHMGPAVFDPGTGLDVRPHPHIGLATVTYLFDGAIQHRDSLGTVQEIRPGDVNWMTAGRGIAHSERSPERLRQSGGTLHGIQTWVALPKADERAEPAFEHHPAESLPVIQYPGVTMRLIVGSAYGQTAPARTYSDMFYLAVEMDAGSSFPLPAEHAQRAVYAVEGQVTVDGAPLAENHMAVPEDAREITIEAATRARLMLLGGAPMDGDRFVWWNFVSSSREAIEEAKERWRSQEFGKVPDETEWIPLPAERKPPESFS